MCLCEYKNIFGLPYEGIHQIRLFDVAIIDLFFTYLLALFICKKYKYNIWKIFFLLILLSIIIHKLFCVNTKFIIIINSLFNCS